MVLSTSASTLAHAHAHALAARPPVETLSGAITNQATGRALQGVRVELLDSVGQVVERRFSGSRGQYSFVVKNTGAYVVREVTPKGFTQVTPTFAGTAPVGAYAPGRGASSWNYHTGNDNPAAGPVGPTNWGKSPRRGTSRSSPP